MTVEPYVVKMVVSVALDHALTYGRVTADDVRRLMPNCPYKRSVFGAAFLQLQQEGYLVHIGDQPSTIPQNHGRRIKIYGLPAPKRVKVCP